MYQYEQLGKVAKIQNGYAFKSSDFCVNGEYPIIKIKNIIDSRIDLSNCDYIEYPHESLNQFKIKYNDILISMTGSKASQPNSAVGKIGRMRIKDKICFLNQRVGKIEVLDEKKTNLQFLYYFLNRKEINILLANAASGSANQANISASQILKLDVPMVSKSTQDKIVSILYPIDCKIEKNNEEISIWKEIVYDLYIERFINVIREPDSEWVKSTVYDNIQEVKEKNIVENNYPVLSVVKEGEFKASEDVFTKQVYSKNTKNYKIVRRNQVAYNPARANIGSIAMLKEYDIGLVSPIYTVFEMKDTITPTFFYYYMKQPIFQKMIKHHAIGTTRQNFPFEAFKMFPMVVPPMELQLKFEEIAKPIEQKIAKLKEENEVLAEIRDTLLHKLMSGELPVEVGEN
jgi:type I restriction enzyme, S subunit